MTTTIDHMPRIDEPPTQVARYGPAGEERLEAEAAPTWGALRALEERLERRATLRDGWTIVMFVCSAIAILGSIVATGLGFRAIDESKRNVRSSTVPATAPAAAAVPSASTPAPPAANVLTPSSPVPVALSDFQVGLSSTNLATGKYTFQISNTGQVPHELLVFQTDGPPASLPTASDGAIQEDAPGVNKVSDGDNLDPGASQTRAVDLSKPGTYVFVCNLPGHFKAGMYSVITVK